MSDDQQRHARTPAEGGWQPMPRGVDIDAEGTAFVQLPPELLAHPGNGASTGWAPLAAPGTGYTPPVAGSSSWDAVPQYPTAGHEPQGGTGGGPQHQPGAHQSVPHQSVAPHQSAPHQQGAQQHQGVPQHPAASVPQASVPQQAGARSADGAATPPDHDDWPSGPYVTGMVDGPGEWDTPADTYGSGAYGSDTYGSGVGAQAVPGHSAATPGSPGTPGTPGAAGSAGSGESGDTAQWPLPFPPGLDGDGAVQSGSTGQWSVPVAGDDPVDESGEYALRAAPRGTGAVPGAEWPAPAAGDTGAGAWHQPAGDTPSGQWSVPAAPAAAGDTPDASGEYALNAYAGEGLTPRAATDVTGTGDHSASGAWEVVTDAPGAPASVPHAGAAPHGQSAPGTAGFGYDGPLPDGASVPHGDSVPADGSPPHGGFAAQAVPGPEHDGYHRPAPGAPETAEAHGHDASGAHAVQAPHPDQAQHADQTPHAEPPAHHESVQQGSVQHHPGDGSALPGQPAPAGLEPGAPEDPAPEAGREPSMDQEPSAAPEPAPEASAAEEHLPEEDPLTGPDPLAGPTGPEEPHAPATEHPCASYVLRVNGTDRPVTDAWIGESLLYVLRERLGLAGAKDGCSQGECGACSVQVDGRLVASCLVPAALTAGSEVRTVEGLALGGQPSDVQRALADCGAVQCGFCVPGLAMTVHDLLEGNHAPTELETRQAICGNLCRCSGYRGVLEAVRQVTEERAEAAAAVEDAQQAGGEPDTATGRIPHQAGPQHGGSGKATA
ncbi:2Fe-2S iron-sulfur cluster-binding protein [Streptomyces sp. I05A-00742]|uniref:2Fe-2S iron-sulfur cluster-binding protein n=1 Tax=Streptomyces sp. I05A-00742 TaxID=2732853 RepID=UPI0014879915|nr:2Fe-2S iron-sulfur cluster-binding protein [Streptomyces sp. I05A-00742]